MEWSSSVISKFCNYMLLLKDTLQGHEQRFFLRTYMYYLYYNIHSYACTVHILCYDPVGIYLLRLEHHSMEHGCWWQNGMEFLCYLKIL